MNVEQVGYKEAEEIRDIAMSKLFGLLSQIQKITINSVNSESK